MNAKLIATIEHISTIEVSQERQEILQPLIDFIQHRVDAHQVTLLNFICTHNSRRSHLAQIWAKAMALYFDVPKIVTYSGGTEATAMFPKVVEVLRNQGFTILNMKEDSANPIYGIKTGDSDEPMIGFSKKYDDDFNPKANFAAIMTCDSADEGCPFVTGSIARIPIKYKDPKSSDGTSEMDVAYTERSLQIASEMYFVMRHIKTK